MTDVILTQERLKEVLNYDPETGIFVWAKTIGKRAIKGNQAGTINTYGYRKIKIDTKMYSAHRLAWFYCHGYFPQKEIDHLNNDKDDNRIANLREVDRCGNMQNITYPGKNNKSGFRGVNWHKGKMKYVARICANGVRYCLGDFANFDDAKNAYLEAKKLLHN